MEKSYPFKIEKRITHILKYRRKPNNQSPESFRKEPMSIECYQKKIEEGFRTIFQVQTLKGTQTMPHGGLNGFMAIVKEPIVKQQIIQFAKLCQDIPVNVRLKSQGNCVFIEFWE